MAWNKLKSGQSLIELMVALGIISLLLISLLTLVAFSVRNNRLAKNRSGAVTLAQGGVELMRTYRDYSWSTFYGKIRSQAYALPNNWTVENGLTADCPTNYPIDNVFRRCVTLTSAGAETVNVAVAVSWLEGSNALNTSQTTQLSLWER